MVNHETDLALPSLEPRLLRRVCSRFASGVTVLTVMADGVPYGMTASSFTAVSLNPPLILVCVASAARFLEACNSSNYFGVNILADTQRTLSERFSRPGRDRFEDVAWNPGSTGTPLLCGMLATMECARFRMFTAGDHEVIIGEVLHAHAREGEPLIHFGSQYRALEISPSWTTTL